MSGKRARASVSKALDRSYSRDESLSPRRRISQLRRYLRELVRDGEDLADVLERLDNGARRRKGEALKEDLESNGVRFYCYFHVCIGQPKLSRRGHR